MQARPTDHDESTGTVHISKNVCRNKGSAGTHQG